MSDVTSREAGGPERIVVIGGGFGGFFALREMARRLDPGEATLTVVTDTDGLLYQPLLPDVAVGKLDPRTIMVPFSALRRTHLVRGHATQIDIDTHVVSVVGRGGVTRELTYDRLLITAGSVSRVLDIPGLAEHGIGFKTAGQALYLRDLVLRRLEMAGDEPRSDVRRELLTFVVVGAGYAGTELVAQMARMSTSMLARFPMISSSDLRWMLLDMAPKVMPELGDSLGEQALRVLHKLDVDVRLQTSIDRIDDDGAHLTDGTWVAGAVVVWCAGVTASAVVAETGLPTERGRLRVDEDLRVPGHPEIFAVGDAAAVPDTTKPTTSEGKPPLCPPTAQHAMRQGRAVARNIAADVRGTPRKAYRHRDLGLVVDLGGTDGVARPLGVPLSGPLATVVTRGYHLYALPTARRRMRAVLGWCLAGGTPDDVSLGLPMRDSLLARAEHTVRADSASGPQGSLQSD